MGDVDNTEIKEAEGRLQYKAVGIWCGNSERSQ